jgi:hypothetical protein
LSDGGSAEIEMFVCTAYPCTLSNPTADIGTLEFIDDPDDDPATTLAMKYTPDLSRLGETAHLAYDVTDKNGDYNKVEFTVDIPSFPTSPNTKTGTNDVPRNDTFRVNSAGVSYDPKHHGNAFFKGSPGPNGGAAENLNVVNSGNISTSGDDNPGIEAKSIGGTGGGGQNGGTKMILFLRFYGSGGRGGWGGSGGNIIVKNTGDIVTSGNHS